MTLTRKSGLKRTGFLKRSGKLKKSNPERQAKRRKAQASKHRKYMASETRKVVDARANGRCEAAVHETVLVEARTIVLSIRDNPRLYADGGEWERCENDATIHHHRTYARYGGNELPRDILKVCEHCHEAIEAQKPAGNRFSRSRR